MKLDTNARRCGNCNHWEGESHNARGMGARCLLSPPVVIQVGSHLSRSEWPVTQEYDRCGSHSAVPTEPLSKAVRARELSQDSPPN